MPEGEPAGNVRRSFASQAALLALIVILAAGLRLWGLGSKSFWYDELHAVEWSRSLRQATVYCKMGHEPPLRYYALHYLTRFDPPELFARLPSFVLGIATVLLIWQLGRRLFGLHVAIVSAFVLAISPWHIQQSQDARMYAVMMFFWVLSVLLFFEALEKPTQALWWPSLAAVHAINFYLSYITVFVLAAQVVTFIGWLVVRRWREGRHLAVGPYTIGALIFVGFFGLFISFWIPPLFDFFARYVGSDARQLEVAIQAVHRAEPMPWPAEFDASFLIGVADNLLIPGVVWRFIALIGLSAGLSVAWRRNRVFVCLAGLSFFLAMVTILFTAAKHFVAPRYIFFVLLFFIVLFSLAIVTMGEAVMEWAGRGWRQKVAAVGLAAAAIGALFVARPVIELYVRAEHQNWKGACHFLTKNIKPDETILTGPWGTHLAMLYYGKPELTENHDIINCRTPVQTADEIERVGPKAWYITLGYIPPELQLILEEKMERVLVLWGLTGVIEIYRHR